MGNDKTKWIFDEENAGRPGGEPDYTESIPPEATNQPTYHRADLDDTRMTNTREGTVIWHGGSAAKLRTDHGMDETVDPVVGWLVVVKGPGLGQAVSLGVGVNAIGRDPGERVALPFGDQLISGRDHAKVFYDDEQRAFFIGHGSGKNITRVNGTIVANPVPLENYALIQMTKVTHLRFVAFCNADFDWSDLDRKDGDAAP